MLNVSAVFIQDKVLRIEMDITHAFALLVQILHDEQYRHIFVMNALRK